MVWDFILNNIGIISGFILGLGVLTPFLLKGKKLIKESAEALLTLSSALEDDKLSKEEVADIINEFSDIIEVFKKK